MIGCKGTIVDAFAAAPAYDADMAKLPMQSLLDDAGLNRHHVFNLSDLPADVLVPLSPSIQERQLILLGHAGRRLWTRVQSEGVDALHPIDDYSVRTVENWLRQALPQAQARFVFPQGLPEGRHIGLQQLGTLAGWHHAAPFMVGVDARWGSWFAYRAAIVTNTQLQPSVAENSEHPCLNCRDKPCINACRGQALGSGALDMQACFSQRLKTDSVCALSCPARQACPVGAEHRYEDSQIVHGAKYSLAAIREYVLGKPL